MKAVDLLMEQKPRVLVLAGPTASGKTALSIQVAKALNCEIVCMDSMQIYRGMDIGTAKPTREEMEGIPHHMLDVADPREAYSVAMYQQQAEQVMGDIVARGHTPLLVGGTGFYLRALRNPMAMGGAGSDADIRAELENIAAEANGREKLHAMLAQVDADTAARLPVNDVRRVIRALEVFRLTGKPFSRQDIPQRAVPFAYRVAALTMERERLYDRVNRRVDQMMAQGLLAEVSGLLQAGVPPDAQAMKGLGYKELLPCVLQNAPVEAAVENIKLGTRHYAKRQLTWLRREEEVLWVDALSPDARSQLLTYYTHESDKGER